jgi:ribonuclease HIII
MMSKLQNQINHVIIQDNKMMSNEKLQQLEEILKPIIN